VHEPTRVCDGSALRLLSCEMDLPEKAARRRMLVSAGVACLTAALVAYGQTWAFVYDEGYHLLAAQLIRRGMRPYLDFCFPQTPLNAYWNAAWMSILGESWRVPHTIAALLTGGAILLLSDFVLAHFPVPRPWRTASAIAAAMLTGMNVQLFGYAPIGQPYALCLFLIVAAFRLAVVTVERASWRWAAATGLVASAAAASSLLTAVVTPVLLLWIAIYSGAERRWTRVAAFLAAAIVPWTPVIWLYALGPRQTWFNVVVYHSKFRKLYWPETTQHDLEVLTSWLDSGQALVLGLLAVGGLLYVRSQREWPAALKARFNLCGWLAVAICGWLALAHPTFARYYLLAVPFLAILAGMGLFGLASRLGVRAPAVPLIVAVGLTAGGLARYLSDRYDYYTWPDYETIAREVDRVTPPNGTLVADELVYFLTRRRPPSGMELYYDHRIPLPAAELALLHILPQTELDRRLSAGVYDTAFLCQDDETYAKLGLAKLYAHREELDECSLFWGRK
jgi:hypothetical protein